MIVKFSYKDEMYRSSNPPATLEALRAFLASTFKTPLPQNFTLFYIIPDQTDSFLLSTEEDYEKFLKLETTKPIKVFIAEPKNEQVKNQDEVKNVDSYGIIDRQPEEVKVNREEKGQKLEDLIENMSESVITSKVQKYPYFAHAQEEPSQDDQIRKIVRETIQEQMGFIVAQVKEAILKELRPVQPAVPVPVVQQVRPVENVEKIEEKKVVEEPVQPVVEERPPKRIFYQGEEVNHEAPVLKVEQPNPLKKIGDVLKGLPAKAKGFFEDFSNMGDPYVVTEYGKFQKSVADKANGMKEMFPEEELKVFLELINRYPRYVTLEQMINVYLNQGEQPQEADEVVQQDENKEENVEKKEEIIDN